MPRVPLHISTDLGPPVHPHGMQGANTYHAYLTHPSISHPLPYAKGADIQVTTAALTGGSCAPGTIGEEGEG